MTRHDRARISRALEQAESGTSGRIAVRIVPDRSVDAMERARREFLKVGLHRHDESNAALILVAPKARQFAVIGDSALHERVGDAFWKDVVRESQPYFARGDVVDGVVFAIGRIGVALHGHFGEPEVRSAQ
ncbi:MAG: TPM domain-containing protein [Candidatus Eremiobacteraeota bacterium]|nr:TPM domain-containing protein [Candidatus Eremiobacteraeota bacterium]